MPIIKVDVHTPIFYFPKITSVYPEFKRVLLVSEDKGTRLAARKAMTDVERHIT
jgi:hypothetical protein